MGKRLMPVGAHPPTKKPFSLQRCSLQSFLPFDGKCSGVSL